MPQSGQQSVSRTHGEFRAAIARQWQVPVFIVSLLGFAGVVTVFRPRPELPSFEESYTQLEKLAQANQFEAFYLEAEELRRQAADDRQIAAVHALAAQVRTRELRRQGQLQVNLEGRRSATENYRAILHDYTQAIQRGHFAAGDPYTVAAFQDMSLAYWALNDAENALLYAEHAGKVADEYHVETHELIVRMLLAARPAGYLAQAETELDDMLARDDIDLERRAWAFVRKADVLIRQDREPEALEMLANADEAMRTSSVGQEIEFLRCRALRRQGRVDEAELALRLLLPRLAQPDDIYAQTALELGWINLEQYRDDDARRFFEMVTSSQMGRDWFVAAKAGLAQAVALQHRYDTALLYYEQAADLLRSNPYNLAIRPSQLQHMLRMQAHQLDLIRRYDLAVAFLEVEQKIATKDDVDAARRYAQALQLRAMQLRDSMDEATAAAQGPEATPLDEAWFAQQRDEAVAHFERAGREFLRVTRLVRGDDELYGEALWQAALCYDRAADGVVAIDLWRRFVHERQGRSRWPEALFRLGQAYQATGRFPEAIDAYRTLLDAHPHAPAAATAMLPLARSFLALDPPDRAAAREVLRAVLADPLLAPEAAAFRDAMFELGQLHYHAGEYPQAISVLGDAITRYPHYNSRGKMMFFVADAYLQSARALEKSLEELADAPADALSRERLTSLRTSHLENARDYFAQAIAAYGERPEDSLSDLDRLYLSQCRVYRADCLFALGRYGDALRAYEEVVLRYQLTPTALSAFVQIVNCHLKMENYADARAANRRAILQLERMSDADLAKGKAAFSRQQWQQWFDWTQNAGVF